VHALVLGDLVLDEQAREVTRAGEGVDLGPTEFALLRYLMRHPRRVLSKVQMLDAVWSYDFGGQAHMVELYISYLRKKIDAGRSPTIHTVRRGGYLIKAPQWSGRRSTAPPHGYRCRAPCGPGWSRACWPCSC